MYLKKKLRKKERGKETKGTKKETQTLLSIVQMQFSEFLLLQDNSHGKVGPRYCVALPWVVVIVCNISCTFKMRRLCGLCCM